MALEIKVLDYGDIELESSFLVLGRECGRVRRVPVYGFLIVGGEYPIVVDTGYRDNAIMETLGMRGLQFHENMIENQLNRFGSPMNGSRRVTLIIRRVWTSWSLSYLKRQNPHAPGILFVSLIHKTDRRRLPSLFRTFHWTKPS